MPDPDIGKTYKIFLQKFCQKLIKIHHNKKEYYKNQEYLLLSALLV